MYCTEVKGCKLDIFGQSTRESVHPMPQLVFGQVETTANVSVAIMNESIYNVGIFISENQVDCL